MLDAGIWTLPTIVLHDAAQLTRTNEPSSMTSSPRVPQQTRSLAPPATSDANMLSNRTFLGPLV